MYTSNAEQTCIHLSVQIALYSGRSVAGMIEIVAL